MKFRHMQGCKCWPIPPQSTTSGIGNLFEFSWDQNRVWWEQEFFCFVSGEKFVCTFRVLRRDLWPRSEESGIELQVHGVIYLVDAFDRERFAEARESLYALLSDEHLNEVPFLILGNKIDIPQAASEEELREALGLGNFTTGKCRAAFSPFKRA